MEASVMDELPPGFRFHPTAEEIIIHYLLNKVIDTRFVSLPISDLDDLNSCEPWDLPKKAKMGENEWFFFYQKDRKYARGMRTNRATKLGYWKATGKDKEIYKKGKKSCLVGKKKTLVFYEGRAPKGERSNWVMHEYRLEGNFSDYNLSKTAKEEWVVCRVFHKKTRNETTDHPGVEVAKLDSYSPTVLPPLTDYSCSSERSPATSTSFATKEEGQDQEFKANISLSGLMASNINQLKTSLQPDQHNFFTTGPYWDPINYLNSSPIFYRQIVPDGSHQYSSLVYSSNSDPIKEAEDQPADSTMFAPDNYINITAGEYEADRVGTMGTFSSFNNSIISPSHDFVKPCDEVVEGLSFCPSMPDLDSLWS
ncbi:hypothetical protein ACS0TY_024674 [Phlomoides rotata]